MKMGNITLCFVNICAFIFAAIIILLACSAYVDYRNEMSYADYRTELRMHFEAYGAEPLNIPDDILDKSVSNAGLTIREAVITFRNFKKIERELGLNHE